MVLEATTAFVARVERSGCHAWAERTLLACGIATLDFERGVRVDRGWASLSHSGRMSCVGWCSCAPIGVDLERVRPWQTFRLACDLVGALPVASPCDEDASAMLGWTDYEARLKAGSERIAARWLLGPGWALSVAGAGMGKVEMKFDGWTKEMANVED